ALTQLVHRRLGEFQPAPACRTWWLRIDRDDLVPCIGHSLQCRRRKLRRTHEDDAQRHPQPTSRPGTLSLASFLNLPSTMSRFSLEMWSMNSTPLSLSISCCRQFARRSSASAVCCLPSRTT